MSADVIVVGAGVAGLALAAELRDRGHRPLVLERSRGVGGRCATRRVEGQPVDHGLPFLHGRDPAFRFELDLARDAGARQGWPAVRVGGGQPCRPAAFEPGSERLAPAGGVKVFARHLADGAEVRLDAQVTSLRTLPERGAGAEAEWEVTLASGERLVAPALALALPAPSAVALLEGMPRTPAAVAAVLPLLALVRTLSCLAVIARYPAAVPGPEWDASFPAGHPVLHSLLNDSSKRGPGARCTLVLQANPRWSREHLDEAPEQWSREVLAQAAALHGEWIAAPELVQAHAWRKARVAEGTELSQPVAVTLDGGARLGLCGDAFHPAGGVEGAWLSGRALAARFHRALESGA